MKIEELKNEIYRCRDCEKQFGFQVHPMFWGNELSKIMIISQAPSKNVHETLKPFNDLTGKKLKYEWLQVTDEQFYDQDNFYMTWIGHCYPGKANGGDRKPPKSCAKRWLSKELEIIKPKLYLIIGRDAFDFVLPNQNFSESIFQNVFFQGIPVYVLPHPSPLNIKWFKDHPQFLQEKVVEIRKQVHEILKGDNNND